MQQNQQVTIYICITLHNFQNVSIFCTNNNNDDDDCNNLRHLVGNGVDKIHFILTACHKSGQETGINK